MSLPLVARLVMAMTLIPNASYVEVFAQLVGVLPRLPWLHAWQVPESTVVTTWRRRLGVAPMKALFTRVAGHFAAATGPGALWHGLRVATLDGCQVKTPDSDANRAAFGSSGTADDSAAFPMARIVLAVARAGRALLAATVDASSVGEAPLTARLVAAHPHLFTPNDVYVCDRNFFSIDLVEAIHRRGQGAHLVMRMKAGVRLPVVQRLGDGDYLSWIRTPDKRMLTVRVVEYDVVKADGTISELFCLLTTLTDQQRYSSHDIAGLYSQRWSAAETTIGENKSTITDAGPSRGPILRSQSPELVLQNLGLADRHPTGAPRRPHRRRRRQRHHGRNLVHHHAARSHPIHDPEPGHRDHPRSGPNRGHQANPPAHPRQQDHHRAGPAQPPTAEVATAVPPHQHPKTDQPRTAPTPLRPTPQQPLTTTPPTRLSRKDTNSGHGEPQRQR